MQIDENKDNAIRESIINATGNLDFSLGYSPLLPPRGAGVGKHNVVGQNADIIQSKNFTNIFTTTTEFSNIRLSFGATNLFRTFTGAIYPYLEYQFTFQQPIADRFYTIE